MNGYYEARIVREPGMKHLNDALRLFAAYQNLLNSEIWDENERYETARRCGNVQTALSKLGFTVNRRIPSHRFIPVLMSNGRAIPILEENYILELLPLNANNKKPCAILTATARIHTPQYVLFDDYTDIIQEDINDPRLTQLEARLKELGFAIHTENSTDELERLENGTFARFAITIRLANATSSIVAEAENVTIIKPIKTSDEPEETLVLPIDAAFSEKDYQFLKLIFMTI